MKQVQLRDLTMHVLDQGSGTPLLFVHGFPLDHKMWKHQIGEFSRHCRVIAPDLRGLGLSRSSEESLTLEQHAEDLNSLLDELEVHEPVIFCGLSMGGYIGWQFLRKYPLRVAALIAVDTRSVADTPDAAQARMKMAERVLNEGPVVAVDAMLPKLFSPVTYQSKPDLVELVRQTILRNDAKGIAASQRALAGRSDVTPWLGSIDVPTLVIVGEHDVISPPAEMHEIANAIPNAAWAKVPNAGHMSPLENPQAFNDAVAHFLTR